MSPAGAASSYLLLLFAVLCVSFGSILARLAQAPALAISFHRVFLASLLLLPFALGPLRRSWPSLTRRRRWTLLASGVALALHFATWIASLGYTSVAVSVLLVNTSPLFTVALSRAFLGETAPTLVLWAIGIAMGGAGIIAAGDWVEGPKSLAGVALALAGSVTFSIYQIIGRGLRSALPLNAYVLGVWATAAAVLGVLALPLRVPLVAYSPGTFAVFLALAVVPTLLGHGLVNRSLRFVPAPTVGLFLLGEPLGASVLACFFFGEVPGAWTLAGGLVVLGALAMVVLGGRE